MNDNKWRVALLLVAFALSAIFPFAMPISEADSVWRHNVCGNWDECGFFELGGRLVANFGGVSPGGHVEIYGEHWPYSLFPNFFVGKIAGGGGRNGIDFLLVLGGAVVRAANHLMGRWSLGLIAGLLVLMCPGYVRMTVGLDTLTLPVLLGLPFLAPVCKRLEDSRPISSGRAALMALSVAIYAILNWTTAFFFLIAGLYLIARIGLFNRRFVLFAMTAAVVTAAVALVSVASKAGGGDGRGMLSFYDSYLFGGGGYGGFPMNWTKAITRLCAANCVGLLPLLVFSGWALVKYRKPPGFAPKMLLPLAGAVASVLFMRNYFAAHPWMAASVLIVGVLFSLALLLDESDTECVPWGRSHPGMREMAWLLGGAGYCYLVVAAFNVNSADADRLITLVKQITPRGSVIVLGKNIDTSGDRQVRRFNDEFDRLVMLSPEDESKHSDDAPTFFLSSAKVPALGEPIAQTVEKKNVLTSAITATLSWYRTHIAKRSPGDRLSLNQTYYLYRYSSTATNSNL